MKKYHLADILTGTEFICAALLLILALSGVTLPSTICGIALTRRHTAALAVFVLGEVCDALDGPCARTWHYPNDGKYRWWRQYASELDVASDIALAASCSLYLTFQVHWSHFVVGIIIAAVCTVIQFLPAHCPHYLGIILARRYLYLAALAYGIITLIVVTSWPVVAKVITISVGVVIGIITGFLKLNRLTERKTPL